MRFHTPPFYTTPWIAAVLALQTIVFGHWSITTAAETEVPTNLRTENLVAWCIVPFDAKRRGPAILNHFGATDFFPGVTSFDFESNIAFFIRLEWVQLRCELERPIRNGIQCKADDLVT